MNSVAATSKHGVCPSCRQQPWLLTVTQGAATIIVTDRNNESGPFIVKLEFAELPKGKMSSRARRAGQRGLEQMRIELSGLPLRLSSISSSPVRPARIITFSLSSSSRLEFQNGRAGQPRRL